MFPPELRVILAAGAAPSEIAGSLADALAAPLDWPRLADLANTSGMLPLLWRALQQSPGLQVPAEFADDVRTIANAQTLRLLRMAGDLTQIMAAFEAAGITAIAFKGPTLAHQAYGSLALRDSADLDIYVPWQHLPRALDILESRGHRRSSPSGNLGLAGTNEVAYRRPEASHEVDLHWQFTPPYFLPFDADRAVRRSVMLRASGLIARTLCLEDLLLYLGLHAARDGWPLRSSCDVAMLLRNCTLDWDDILRETGRMRCWRPVAVALQLAAELFHAPVPAEIARRVQGDRTAVEIAGQIASILARWDPDYGGRPGGAWLHLRTIETMAGRVRYVWRRAVQPNQLDASFLRLPARFSAAYYAVRPVRVACVGLSRLWPLG